MKMNRMKTVGIVLCVLALTIQSSIARDCNFLINGRLQRYRHGEIFTFPQSRCQVHRCEDGRDSIMKQACDFEGECRDVGSSFVGTTCATYTCTMPSRNYLMVKPIRGGCKDVNNICRQPGETFAINDRGIYRAGCQCQIHGSGTNYQCQA